MRTYANMYIYMYTCIYICIHTQPPEILNPVSLKQASVAHCTASRSSVAADRRWSRICTKTPNPQP